MAKEKIAIACQGGGSQTAFTAGVLISLFKHKAYEKHRIVSLSGTSGGAICAALAWQELIKWSKGDRSSIGQSLESFWRDNGTENLLERFLNDALIQYVQLVDHGFLPEWKTSPYSPWHQAWTAALQLFLPEFYDFKGLLQKHLKLNELGNLMAETNSPVLVIGAADVKTGEFKKFNTRDGNVDIDALLASAAVPSLSKAVEIGSDAYWDGLFSDNPPTDELIDDAIVGKDNIPDQLWVIQINPRKSDGIPKTSDEIIDRRNEMIGNASLYQDLQHICRINKWLRREAFKDSYKAEHHLQIVKIYVIQMDDRFQNRLNYATKLDRDEKYIQDLIAHGEERGQLFLENSEPMRFD
ncbi:MAG: patatin-like phospholipase family protein [Desulfobacteraceae bacterium]|jgi:NTE family protein